MFRYALLTYSSQAGKLEDAGSLLDPEAARH